METAGGHVRPDDLGENGLVGAKIRRGRFYYRSRSVSLGWWWNARGK